MNENGRWIELVQKVGFPIVVSLLLLWQLPQINTTLVRLEATMARLVVVIEDVEQSNAENGETLRVILRELNRR